MTAKQIEKEFGITYSRQAVAGRVKKHPERLKEIEDEKLDIAESKLSELMNSPDERIALRATEFYLDRKGKNRGYTTKQEMDVTSNGEGLSMPTTIIVQNPHQNGGD